MPYIINHSHFETLKRFPREAQGPVGWMPTSWVDIVLDEGQEFEPPLPAIRFDRNQLRSYCRDETTPPMHAFISVMAWGKQMPQKLQSYREEIALKRTMIEDMVKRTRDGASRQAAYDMWRKKVTGLGPSYITKLLAFLSPTEDMAIMDQWAVKSINLLYDQEVIRLLPKGSPNCSPDASCRGTDYERYCSYLEDLQGRLVEPTLSATEERIFSKSAPATWREYVIDTWRA
jgi:hypothetical protein